MHRVKPRKNKERQRARVRRSLFLSNSLGQLSVMARVMDSTKTNCCPRPRRRIMRKYRADHKGGTLMLAKAIGNITKRS